MKYLNIYIDKIHQTYLLQFLKLCFVFAFYNVFSSWISLEIEQFKPEFFLDMVNFSCFNWIININKWNKNIITVTYYPYQNPSVLVVLHWLLLENLFSVHQLCCPFGTNHQIFLQTTPVILLNGDYEFIITQDFICCALHCMSSVLYF